METTPQPLVLKGSPIEIGAQLFTTVCMPVVRQAQATQGVTAEGLAHLYAGFLQACLGSLAADFGHAQAIVLAEMMVEEFKKVDLEGQPQKAH